MTKWKYAIEWLFMSMILHYGCPDDFVSHACLEAAIDFAWSRTACSFTLRTAKSELESDRFTCLQKCQVKIDNLIEPKWYAYEYRLKSLALIFDGLSKNLQTIDNRCISSYTYPYERTWKIICNTSLQNEDIGKNLCTSGKSCEDLSKSCSQSSTEQIGVCVCRDGYLRYGNKCFKGNLQLNEMCQRNVQCTGTVGLICHNQKCVCRQGYFQINDSVCLSSDISDSLCTSDEECRDESKSCLVRGQVGICACKSGFIGFGNDCLKGDLSLHESCQRNEQCSMVLGSVCENNICTCREGYVSSNNDSECSFRGRSQASVQGQKEDNAVSVTVGAVFGGLILGIVLTVLGVIIYKNIRNGKPKAGKKQDQTVAFFNNTSYETEREAHQNHSTVQRANERKIVNVPPFAHSMDLPVTENTYTNKSSMANSHDVNNDVYNHLH
ncbi:uncharacterized protein LOC134248492 isoform X2 [Saccostrea cucullata]|uniref:uncharacterized protein LOC134248492 isoform X2 n=1 Tax=Saccostrea cuccullata TaxID=36930 RepID=UPI002ED01DE8